jgi:DNA polymerase III subunit beta
MKFSASRETVLKPLQAVIGVVERRQTMPILSNVLLVVKDGVLSVTATDLEVELVAEAVVEQADAGEITVPGRKLHDIVRALPDGATVEVGVGGERMTVKAGRSRFTLSTLRAGDFPTIEDVAAQQTIDIDSGVLQQLVEKTHFSMAQQDVRYYLNGLLLETDGQRLRAVATDGHRLALADAALERAAARSEQLILPRKGVLELNRLLGGDGRVQLQLGASHLRARVDGLRLTSKLIDGRFPDYGRVIPSDPPYVLMADRDLLKQALQRAAILSNEKYRGVRLQLQQNSVVSLANNPEQEEAVETVELEYDGEEMEIGFNVNYLLDALGAIDGEQVRIGVPDGNSSCLITEAETGSVKFVVMPMRL